MGAHGTCRKTQFQPIFCNPTPSDELAQPIVLPKYSTVFSKTQSGIIAEFFTQFLYIFHNC